MVKILAPTPKIYPSAAVNIGHSDYQKQCNAFKSSAINPKLDLFDTNC